MVKPIADLDHTQLNKLTPGARSLVAIQRLKHPGQLSILLLDPSEAIWVTLSQQQQGHLDVCSPAAAEGPVPSAYPLGRSGGELEKAHEGEQLTV